MYKSKLKKGHRATNTISDLSIESQIRIQGSQPSVTPSFNWHFSEDSLWYVLTQGTRED